MIHINRNTGKVVIELQCLYLPVHKHPVFGHRMFSLAPCPTFKMRYLPSKTNQWLKWSIWWWVIILGLDKSDANALTKTLHHWWRCKIFLLQGWISNFMSQRNQARLKVHQVPFCLRDIMQIKEICNKNKTKKEKKNELKCNLSQSINGRKTNFKKSKQPSFCTLLSCTYNTDVIRV